MADRKLTNQIIPIIFCAFPVEDLERGDIGRQMARYLRKRMVEGNNLPLTGETNNGKNGSISDGLNDHYLGVAGKLSKDPRVLVPHQVELARES